MSILQRNLKTLAPPDYTDTFSNYPVGTHTYTNTYEQQPYCLGTLSQMTEWSAERRVRQETGWLASGPLIRVATIMRITDTFLFISHTTNVLLFKFRCNILIGVSIIKEMPGSVPSGTHCICYNIILNMFQAVPCSSSGGQIVLLQPLVSSLSPLSALNRHTVRPFTESDDTRCCNNTICPPEDEHSTVRKMSRIIM